MDQVRTTVWYGLQLANIMYGSMLSLMRQRAMTLSIYTAMENAVTLRPKWKTQTADDTHNPGQRVRGYYFTASYHQLCLTLNWDKATISERQNEGSRAQLPLFLSFYFHDFTQFPPLSPLHHSILHCSLSRSPIDERRLLVTLRSACVRTPA